MDEQQQVTISGEGEDVTIVGRGALDLSNCKPLGDGLERAAASAQNVTVDLREATYVDSAVLQYLASAYTAMDARGAHLRILVSVGSQPLYVLKVLQFDSIMEVVVDESAVVDQASEV